MTINHTINHFQILTSEVGLQFN